MKTAEEWTKGIGFSYIDDVEPIRQTIRGSTALVEWIKQIQLDAYKAGMTESAEVCKITERNCRQIHLLHVHAELGCDRCRAAILHARDNKTEI